MEYTKHYLCVLDADNGCITAALSCPSREIAQKVHLLVLHRIKAECSEIKGFKFGYAWVDSPPDSDIIGSPFTQASFPHGWRTSAAYDNAALKFVVSKTEKHLSDVKNTQRDIRFMRYVKLAMAGLSLDEPDYIDETTGRWVSQDEFLGKKGITLRTLQTYRNKGKKSENGLSGTDSQGNRWRKTGTSQSEKPEYFLLNDE